MPDSWKLLQLPRREEEAVNDPRQADLKTASDIETLAKAVDNLEIGSGATWEPAQPDESGYVRFHGGGPYGHYGYAVVYVKSQTECGAVLRVESVGGVAAWLNGRQVLKVPDFHRYPFCGQEEARVQLQEGWNQVLLQVRPLHAFWGFRCYLLDEKGREMPDLTYALELK